MPPWILNNRHYTSEVCWLGQERQLRQETLQRCFEAIRVAIRFNLEPLEATTAFPYLGRTVTFKNSGWAALCRNLRKAQRQ